MDVCTPIKCAAYRTAGAALTDNFQGIISNGRCSQSVDRNEEMMKHLASSLRRFLQEECELWLVRLQEKSTNGWNYRRWKFMPPVHFKDILGGFSVL
jgi:hypothetical protein